MARRAPTSTGRKIASVGAVIVALVAVAGLAAAWRNAHPTRDAFCTLAGSIGTPLGDTPEQAFERWWTDRHPDGPTQDEANIDRTGEHVWDIDKGTSDWVRVDVNRADHFDPEQPHDKWSVSGANSCRYAHG